MVTFWLLFILLLQFVAAAHIDTLCGRAERGSCRELTAQPRRAATQTWNTISRGHANRIRRFGVGPVVRSEFPDAILLTHGALRRMRKDAAVSAQPSEPRAGSRHKTIWMAHKVVQTPIGDLKPYANNNRVHDARNIGKLKASVEQFGFVMPILIDGNGVIIAGHGRYEAAKALGIASVPTVIADHLRDEEVRALRIADNRLAELSDWDEEALQIELGDLMDLRAVSD